MSCDNCQTEDQQDHEFWAVGYVDDFSNPSAIQFYRSQNVKLGNGGICVNGIAIPVGGKTCGGGGSTCEAGGPGANKGDDHGGDYGSPDRRPGGSCDCYATGRHYECSGTRVPSGVAICCCSQLSIHGPGGTSGTSRDCFQRANNRDNAVACCDSPCFNTGGGSGYGGSGSQCKDTGGGEGGKDVGDDYKCASLGGHISGVVAFPISLAVLNFSANMCVNQLPFVVDRVQKVSQMIKSISSKPDRDLQGNPSCSFGGHFLSENFYSTLTEGFNSQFFSPELYNGTTACWWESRAVKSSGGSNGAPLICECEPPQRRTGQQVMQQRSCSWLAAKGKTYFQRK